MKLLGVVFDLQRGAKMWQRITVDYLVSYANFRRRASDLIHMSELLESRLSDSKEPAQAESKKSTKKIGCHFRTHDNFKQFEESISVKLMDVLSMMPIGVPVQIKDWELLAEPKKFKDRKGQNPNKFYHYHNDTDHYTSECRHMLKQFWSLYEKGVLDDLVERPQDR